MTTTTGQGYVQAVGEGRALWALGERIALKATGAQTGGAFTLLEDLVAAGGEPPPHLHEREDEAYYLLEGYLRVTVGERTLDAGPGSFIYLPRAVPHSWKVVDGDTARFLALFAPSGIEGFFERLGRPAQAATPPPPAVPDIEAVVRVAAEYGIRLAGPPPA
jgi:quercetin dioxygenase-like cupin family protein